MSQTKIEEQRELLDSKFREIPGIKGVYFQPPSNEKLKYPCVIYTLKDIMSMYSDDSRYLSIPVYDVTMIDYNPESEIQRYMLDLNDGCYVRFDRFYTSDNLNHWVYQIHFLKALW